MKQYGVQQATVQHSDIHNDCFLVLYCMYLTKLMSKYMYYYYQYQTCSLWASWSSSSKLAGGHQPCDLEFFKNSIVTSTFPNECQQTAHQDFGRIEGALQYYSKVDWGGKQRYSLWWYFLHASFCCRSYWSVSNFFHSCGISTAVKAEAKPFRWGKKEVNIKG